MREIFLFPTSIGAGEKNLLFYGYVGERKP